MNLSVSISRAAATYDTKSEIRRLDPPVRRQACLLKHGWVGETRLKCVYPKLEI
jgi:hypothetical protein